MPRTLSLLGIILLAISLLGCGQKGSLYLPQQADQEKQVDQEQQADQDKQDNNDQ